MGDGQSRPQVTTEFVSPLVSLRGIGKTYGVTTVLEGIDMDFRPGECVALVGENGAGKSTMVGILSGKIAPTSGTLAIAGNRVGFRSPRDARALGIEFIPQELAYIPALTVAENIALGNWPQRRVIARRSVMERECRQLFERLEIDIDVRRTMSDLSLAGRQLVEIAKALAGEARLLLLDEPTAALHAHEAQLLLDELTALKARGVSIIYISHRLDECAQIGDRIAVLRNGRLVSDKPTVQTSLPETVTDMLGREYHEIEDVVAIEPDGRALIEVSHWKRAKQPTLDDVCFSVRPGEVLGIFGLIGSGGAVIARGLGGHDRVASGTIRTPSRTCAPPRSPRAARALSIAYIPAERKTDGLALNQSVYSQLVMMVLNRSAHRGWIGRRAQIDIAHRLQDRFDVRCRSVTQDTAELSGGNQQKILLASRVAANPSVLVLHEPTRGVDIGSRGQIHEALRAFARERGAGVVIVTSDVHEAASAPDRLLVLRNGRIIAELQGDDKNATRALALAAGGKVD